VLTSERVLSLTGPGHAILKADLCRIEGELQPMESVDRFLKIAGGGGGISIEENTLPPGFMSLWNAILIANAWGNDRILTGQNGK
jgi:hypothetical protein